MLGQFLVHGVWALAVGAAVTFALGRRRQEFLVPARVSFALLVAGIGVLWLLLLGAVLTHDFRYTYVWGHSSRQLPFHLLLSSSYAGQEGSLMLWVFWLGLLGIAVHVIARRQGWEAEMMSLYSAVVAGMLLLLVAKNPFTFVWETYAEQGVAEGFRPADGRGLNPLLHNYWIVFHPPTLFLGFALVSVPFVFALAGLWRREYQRWIVGALPWLGIAAAVLGGGILLGGLWAYETLGWGGFWAWDPVENSSLVPWLFVVAALHTGLIQRRTGGLVRTTVVLVVLAFLATLYSTFLTRSGVLGDTSVHSFVDPGLFAYVLLLGLMVAGTAVSVGFLLWRWRELQREALQLSVDSREFLLGLGTLGLVVSAVVVLVGTSYPIVAELLGRPKVAVEQRFYNLLHLPLGVWILLLNGLSLLAQWRATPGKLFGKRLLLPAAIAGGGTGLLWMLGIRDGALLALAATAWFALAVNGRLLFGGLRRRPAALGAWIAHTGLALLLVGVVTLAALSWTSHARLPRGEPVQLGAYRLTYLGREQVEREYTDREKWRYAVRVEHRNGSVTIFPVLFWSDYNQRQSAFLEPGIAWRLAADFYMAPRAVESENPPTELVFRRGEEAPLPSEPLVRASVLRFEMGAQHGDTLEVAVWIVLRQPERDDTLRLASRMLALDRFLPLWQPFRDTLELALLRILPDRRELARSQAVLGVRRRGTQEREVLTVEFSLKPGINLVWLGGLLTVVGLLWSAATRLRQKRRIVTCPDGKYPAPVHEAALPR
ncbi:Cytochrome c-type biogenesis protein CcmF [bacterium HR21]|nr:Cytochrome c-type biogenesis protein CcmF [bacterium HR21]